MLRSSTRIIINFICFLLVMQYPLLAQKSQISMREADDMFSNMNYAACLPVYLEELKKEPESAMLNYKVGVCYLYSRSMKAKSVPYLETAVLNSTSYLTKSYNNEKDAPLNAYKHLGDAYYLTYNFPSAIKTYEKYRELLKENKTPDLAEIGSAEAKLGMCRLVKDLKPQLTLPIASSSGKPCNGDLVTGDYSTTLSPDKSTMIYTVKVPVNKLMEDDGSSQYFERMPNPPSDTTGKKKTKSETANTSRKNLELDTVVYASTVGTSFDGQVVLTYKNDDGEGNLYVIKLKDNKWTTPVRVVKGANFKGWEQHETVSADGNTMYFVSDRPGGYGGKDIYKCTKMPDGEWSKAVNVGPPVNTEADETAPFIHPNNGILYFSSNRIKTGSYDIFASALSGKEWSKPSNVGYPINRHDHDIFQVTADNRKLYPTTKGGVAKEKETEGDTAKTPVGPDNEHLLISFVNQEKIALNVLKGKVMEKESLTPLRAKITVTDNNSGAVIGQYHSDSNSGLYSMVLPAGKNLGITYESADHLLWSENYQVNKDNNYFEKQKKIKMQLIEPGSTGTLTNVFFEGNSETPTLLSSYEIEKLYQFLESNQAVKIELTDYIFSKENKKFNKKLAEKRAGVTKKILVEKGISADRITTAGKAKAHEEPKKEKKDKSAKAKKKDMSAQMAPPPSQVLEFKISKIEKLEKQ